MQIINGHNLANNVLDDCIKRLQNLKFVPTLAIIMIGNNPASLTYVEKKHQAGKQVGVDVTIYKYDTLEQHEAEELIQKLNNEEKVRGIILQLPLPQDLDTLRLCKLIDPLKDVDGLNPENFGELWLNNSPKLIPATVKAIYYTLKYIAQQENSQFEEYINGKTVLCINRSAIIGKPLAGFLLNYNATIIMAHSQTQKLENLIGQSDIIISGTGKEDFITSQTFKPHSVLIDVGFNKRDKIVYGDVTKRLENNNIAWLTPVPGGIGPIGVACLIENTIIATELLFA